MLVHEHKAHEDGFSLVIGIDEAGRGPLAGPVVAAAVAIRDHQFESKICDSKRLSELQREKSCREIYENCYVGVGIINESVIDSLNILRATYHAMSVAVEQLVHKIPQAQIEQSDFNKKVCLLVDGQAFKTYLPYHYRPIIKGDASSLSIASASIVAKVTRDRILLTYDKVYPQYGFRRHKGYPTRQHKQAIHKYGPSLIHRKTFNSK